MQHNSRKTSSNNGPWLLCAFVTLTACTAPLQEAPGSTITPPVATTSTAEASPTASALPESTTPAPEPSAESTASQEAGSTPAPVVNGGTVQLTIVAPDLPAGSSCLGFARTADTVQSGGGGLGGATQQLGRLSPQELNTISLLPSTYTVTVRCTSGADTWQGEQAEVRVRRDVIVEQSVTIQRTS